MVGAVARTTPKVLLPLLPALLCVPCAFASAPLILLPDVTISGEGAMDRAGSCLAGAGDVDGDGLDDLLIGVQFNEENATWSSQGQVYVVLGRTGGWASVTDLSQADGSFVGEADGEELGTAVAGAGDVDGDGLDDLLMAAPRADAGLLENGLVYLVLGRGTGWALEVTAADADCSFAGEGVQDNAGRSVSGLGDVDGDGYGDFAISAHSNDEAGTSAGQVYVMFGDPGPWPASLGLGSADASFHGEAAHDQAGYAVAGAGDVDGDGFDDIVVGARRNDEAGSNTGKTYLVMGGDTGWAMDTSLASADASFLGLAIEDEAGATVAGPGDVDGDGYDDLLIGAPDADDGDFSAGSTYVILGGDTGWLPSTSLAQCDGFFVGEGSGDLAGEALAGGGDFDADGLADFVIGAPESDEAASNAGQAYLVLGRAGAWPLLTSLSEAHASLLGSDVDDELEGVVLAGDLDGDGFDDLVAGASGADGDSYHNGVIYIVFGFPCGDADGDGFDACGTDVDPADCDDGDPAIHPGAIEVCDLLDNDCDGMIDESLDDDGDGQTPCGGDCDDADPNTYAGAVELCDGLDNDCDGAPDQDEVDADGDGYPACGECDDGDDSIHPGAPDTCDDGIDSDCMGDLEDTEVDDDGDDLSECAGDCDDTDANVHPYAPEICNQGVDDDCNPMTDEEVDGDGDHFTICEGDCDDTEPTATPVGVEVCDGVDNDCSGLIDDGIDYDRDGWYGCGGEDCDDHNADAHPGAPEIPYDGVDQNCDGADVTDIDRDGYDGGPYGEDCHDGDPTIHPGAHEVCDDYADNDCDGRTDQYDASCSEPPPVAEEGCECRLVSTSRTGMSLVPVLLVLGLACRRRRA